MFNFGIHSLKWKPPSENSIDFRLELRFPPAANGTPDLAAKPLFVLMMNCGREPEEPFDLMEVADDEWEAYVTSLYALHLMCLSSFQQDESKR